MKIPHHKLYLKLQYPHLLVECPKIGPFKKSKIKLPLLKGPQPISLKRRNSGPLKVPLGKGPPPMGNFPKNTKGEPPYTQKFITHTSNIQSGGPPRGVETSPQKPF